MSEYLPITILKEYTYCPRLAYLKLKLTQEPPTPSMTYGKQIEKKTLIETIGKTEKGTIMTDIHVKSKKLKLTGKIDGAIINENKATIIEIKTTNLNKKKLHTTHKHILTQITAYAIATEETLGKTVEQAIIITEEGKTIRIRITPWMRQEIALIAKQLHQTINNEQPPQTTPNKNKCKNCHYNKYCTT